MVVSLGPGKFYGRSLPRPRYYTDVKFNDARVDPPAPVLDPLLEWASEAHWSMGGLSFKRLRLQGRIEGSVSKLRIEREKSSKKKKQQNQIGKSGSEKSDDVRDFTKSKSLSPPPAPIAPKRRRFTALLDEENEEDEGLKSVPVVKKRRLVKRLGDDFDRVASENAIDSPSEGLRGSFLRGKGVGEAVMKVVHDLNKENSKGKKMKGGDGNNGGETESASVKSTRSSPRLANKKQPC